MSSATSRVTEKLRELHRRNGCPSSRAVSYRTDGAVSHTTVAYLLSGKKCPRWTALANIALALRATPADMQELRDLWDAAEEVRKSQRPQPTPKIREGLVIRPGDTILITVEELSEEWTVDRVETDLGQMFPDNKVKVIIGADVAVIRAGEEAAA